MRWVLLVDRVLLVLLGVATGAVKLARMKEEMELFRGAGFPDAATLLFGVVQIAAALALIHPRSLRAGAAVLALTFLVATVVVFVNGMIPFGVASISFIAMAGLLAAVPPR
ncbi:MAG: DoxX family protein [Myxococcales bacterium]|nr:DoxX family protein [Myxococcales bacterium]